MRVPVGFALSSNQGKADTANTERMVNLFAEQQAPSSKSSAVLLRAPGTELMAELAFGSSVLGLHVFGEDLIAVTDKAMYRVKSGSKIPNYLGPVDFIGKTTVSIADNGIQVVVVDGDKGYYWSEGDGVNLIDSEAFYPANTVTYQDGYFIFNREGTGQFFISKLLSVEFDALEFATAEGSPDDTVAVISNYRELWLFGTRSVEIWYNNGNVDFPFARLQGAFIERGCAAPRSITKVDSKITWLGDDGIIYMAVGYQPQRISTHAVEYSISQLSRRDDAIGWWYSENGHVFYVITWPQDSITWCFDVATGLWHERSHFDHGRHEANDCAYFDGMNVIGSFYVAELLELSQDLMKDRDRPLVVEATSMLTHNGRERMTARSFEVDMAVGRGRYPVPEDPQAMLQWSDDGGRTWSNEHWKSLGKMGEYRTRVKWNRCGMFRQRAWRLTISDPVPVSIMSAWMEV